MQINSLRQVSPSGAPCAGFSWSSSPLPCVWGACGSTALCCVDWEDGAGWGEAHQHTAFQTLCRDSPPHWIRLGKCCVLVYASTWLPKVAILLYLCLTVLIVKICISFCTCEYFQNSFSNYSISLVLRFVYSFYESHGCCSTFVSCLIHF